jgi:hypothetical protein
VDGPHLAHDAVGPDTSQLRRPLTDNHRGTVPSRGAWREFLRCGDQVRLRARPRRRRHNSSSGGFAAARRQAGKYCARLKSELPGCTDHYVVETADASRAGTAARSGVNRSNVLDIHGRRAFSQQHVKLVLFGEFATRSHFGPENDTEAAKGNPGGPSVTPLDRPGSATERRPLLVLAYTLPYAGQVPVRQGTRSMMNALTMLCPELEWSRPADCPACTQLAGRTPSFFGERVPQDPCPRRIR